MAVTWEKLAYATDVIGGDGTAGRVLREIRLEIGNGTDAETLNCEVFDVWNGDTIAETDNIAKDATTGNFTLSADGSLLIIEASGLTGNCVFAWGLPSFNNSGTDILYEVLAYLNDIAIRTRNRTTNSVHDMTALVDIGRIHSYLFYLTDA